MDADARAHCWSRTFANGLGSRALVCRISPQQAAIPSVVSALRARNNVRGQWPAVEARQGGFPVLAILSRFAASAQRARLHNVGYERFEAAVRYFSLLL